MSTAPINIDLQLTPTAGNPRILVAGSDAWDDERMVVQVLFMAYVTFGQHERTTLLHAGRVAGAEMVARRTWRELKLPCGLWTRGDVSPDVCLAFIRDGDKAVGALTRYCYDAGIPVRAFEA